MPAPTYRLFLEACQRTRIQPLDAYHEALKSYGRGFEILHKINYQQFFCRSQVQMSRFR